MITTIVGVILALLLVTKLGGLVESLITLAFLSFFFLYLLRLLNVIDTPFKVGQERTEDDVSLFLLSEFVVHAQAAAIEEQLVEVEEVQSAELEAAAEADEAGQDAAAIGQEAAAARERLARPDA